LSKTKFKPQPLNGTKQKKQKTAKQEFWSWILSLVIAVSIALSLRIFVFDFVVVESISMEDTLYAGEVLFLEKVSYNANLPETGDIIVCRFDDGRKNYIKRVIGQPGDTVSVEAGTTYVNSIPLDEPYLPEAMLGNYVQSTVPDDAVFIMGDNRNNSFDSRAVGTVPLEKVRGKAVFRVWPFSRFGKLD